MRWDSVYQVCSIVLAFLLNGCGSADHRVLEEVVERVHSLEPGANVSIHNGDGAVLVYGSDEDNIRVQCVKKAYSQERLNQIAIDVAKKPGAVSITAKSPPHQRWAFSDHSGTVDCTIVVPATASVFTIDLNAGEVVLNGIKGREIHAHLGDGRIFARNCFTNLDATLDRGTLTVGYDWWEVERFSARLKLEQGNASVFLPTMSAFHLVAAVAHGKIANDFNDVPLTPSSSSEEMKIDRVINGGGSTTIQIQVDRGNIKIAEANP